MIEVSRKVTVWQLGTVVSFLVMQMAATYYGLQSVGDKQKDQTAATNVLSSQIGKLVEDGYSRKAKDQEQDFNIKDHERRINSLEAMTAANKGK